MPELAKPRLLKYFQDLSGLAAHLVVVTIKQELHNMVFFMNSITTDSLWLLLHKNTIIKGNMLC